MEIQSLSGVWSLLRAADGSEYPIRIPGENITALFEAGRIPDPYHRMNEQQVQWIGRESWVIKRTFTCTPAMAAAENLFLEFESIDTLAEVSVNGTIVGTSENMFLRRRFPVSGAVIAGENTLEVYIRSAEAEAYGRRDRAGVEARLLLLGEPMGLGSIADGFRHLRPYRTLRFSL